MRSILSFTPVLVTLLVVSLTGGVRADDDPRAEAGYGFYMERCAVCHGVTGTGDGPLAPDLKRPPSDLTRITERHGSFPQAMLVEVIDGRRRVAGHGLREMPVWGREFSRQTGEHTGGDLVIRARIQLLVDYLRSIQKPQE